MSSISNSRKNQFFSLSFSGSSSHPSWSKLLFNLFYIWAIFFFCLPNYYWKLFFVYSFFKMLACHILLKCILLSTNLNLNFLYFFSRCSSLVKPWQIFEFNVEIMSFVENWCKFVICCWQGNYWHCLSKCYMISCLLQLNMSSILDSKNNQVYFSTF